MLFNLPQQSKDLLQANGFSVSKSDMPASRTAVDMPIEQTINKHARPVVELSDLAEACQHITDGVSQGITELNTSQQHIRWPTLNQRTVKLIKNLLFPKGNSVKRLSRKL
ncbi:hypothetical protein PoB_001517300 [Plakobranchus ocellatus]|uniref:Uncharacterized protein n=1 Tax=Plakobranchus ocellatus TaxID=259542 RepID=A0AAV3Z1L3_9GAST|nr:hypothetical protein PoB_001517300 [Plakobranchus ocellatus]